jgi:methylmalonyl-CoA/ethylmalonyl-CoA epimerase
MTPTRIEHIGIAVRTLDEAIPVYEKMLGTRCYAIEEVEDQRVKTAFFRVGETKIELLEATSPDGPVARFIEKRGEGIHHIALAVENVQQSIDEMVAGGIEAIDKTPRPGAEGFQIAFMHPRSTFGVLTELCGIAGPALP